MNKLIISKQLLEVGKAQEFIRKSLKSKKIGQKEIAQTLLTSEEVLAQMVSSGTPENNEIAVSVVNSLGDIEIHIRDKGTPIDVGYGECFGHDDDPEIQKIIDNLTSRVFSDRIQVKRSGDSNHVILSVGASPQKQLILMGLALLLGVAVGFLFKLLIPENISSFVCTNIFETASTLFLNAIKFIVAPLVFLSIASSISEFKDMKALGRIGGKVIGGYTITSVIAIFLGMLVYKIMPIGDPALRSMVSGAGEKMVAASQQTAGFSFKDMITNIIPVNFVSPVLNADMIQIIFMAVLVGIAVSQLGEHSDKCRSFLQVMTSLFVKIISIVIKFMPLAVFCSIAKMVYSIDTSSLASILLWPAANYIGFFIMLLIYSVLLLVMTGLNPLVFFRNYKDVMIGAFTLNSSSAVMPLAMESCEKKLGISRKICSFSIPLGATINMDGNCITLMISSFFMAKIFGVTITPAMLFSLAVSIFVLSVGAPGIPGGTLVCLAMALPEVGVPGEAISIVMGLYSIVGMMMTATNVTGDAIISTIVAKSEKLLDKDVFYSKN